MLLTLQLLIITNLIRTQTYPSVYSYNNQFNKIIYVRKNLREIPNNISTNTRLLNLHKNQIQIIKINNFKHLKHLKILQLNKNHIKTIKIKTFNNLTNLNTLKLFNNRLTTIPNKTFIYLSKLKKL